MTEKGGVGGLVSLCTSKVGQGYHKTVLFGLLVGDLMEWVDRDLLLIAFYFSVSLCVICSLCHVYCTKMCTQGAKEFVDTLCTVVS